MYWLAHTAGFVGLVLIATSWQFKRLNSIRALNGLAFLVFALQLFLLGAITGALGMIAAALFVFGILININKVVLSTFLIFCNLALFSTIDDAIDTLPIIANIWALAVFGVKHESTMRLLSPVGTILWAIYNLHVGAWSQFLADLVILASMALGAARAYRRHDDAK